MAISQFKRARLMKKLGEHIGFVQRSNQAFDIGVEEEAIRIAVSLRVIFHHTSASTSLVAHLGLANNKMLSSSRGGGNWMDYLRQQINLQSPQPVRMLPMLENKFREVSIEDWWKNEPVFSHKDKEFARKRIILSAANKDGGAHVDEELEEYYESLCSGEHGLGITGDLKFDGVPPFPQGATLFAQNTHLALIRQFGYEFLASVSHFKWLA